MLSKIPTLIICKKVIIFCVSGMTARLNNTAGAITLSKTGEVGVHFSSKRMAWAYVRDDKIFYGIEQGEVLTEENKLK